MPNIEIHGFAHEGLIFGMPFRPANALGLKARIFEIFTSKPYASEIVVTLIVNQVFDAKGENQPFLRVVSTPSAHLDEIIKLLKTLNIDIEVMMLSAFHPKKPSAG